PRPAKDKSSKGKKSPRRSDDEKTPEQSPKSKKPRVLSLFGGPISQSDDVGDDADDEAPPKTLAQGMDMRMSSLTLDQQQEEDNGEGPSRPSFNLAATLGLSDNDSPRGSPAPSAVSMEDEVPAEDPVVSYGLRKNIDRQVVPVTWVDVDQSGNYDPEEERQKAKAAKAKKRKGKQKAVPNERHIKCIVRLPFKAIGTVENITNREENWPDNWSMIDSEDERELQEFRAFYRRRTPGVEAQVPIEDPKGEYDDLTGHPVARGCQGCRRLGQDCSMVENGGMPCSQCFEDGIECHPIAEQEQRVDLNSILYGPDRTWVPCTYCRLHKKRCSLKTKEDQPPCKYCKRNGIGCTFYDLPNLEMPKKGGKKKAVQAGIASSSAPNIAPEVSMPGSDIFDAEDLADLEREDEEELVREETPEIEMEDAEGRRGILTEIQTSFAHPIKFSTLESSSICSFCEMPSFGFTGHFEKTVHVLRWNNGLGYTELAAGHREDNDATIMCQECVMQRVQTIYCPAHGIRRIENLSLDYDEAVNQLITAEPGSMMMRHELQRWCSLCFSLAVFKCGTVQPSIMDQGDDDQALIEGCGLRLCEPCERKLREDYSGDLDEMATVCDNEPKARVDSEDGQVVIRADVGFLRKEGLLMANVGHNAGD
ncbi:hypothetical protein BU26DRAFT_392833, partial [Trematosphaeria pertusa]